MDPVVVADTVDKLELIGVVGDAILSSCSLYGRPSQGPDIIAGALLLIYPEGNG